MATLLDSNVLIALLVEDHVHHRAAAGWFAALRGRFATCPISQGAFVRLVLREGGTADQARTVLRDLTDRKGHEFWPDDLAYAEVAFAGVVGHRQVTDAYLASLARHHGGRLATLDRGLHALRGDVTLLIDAGVV